MPKLFNLRIRPMGLNSRKSPRKHTSMVCELNTKDGKVLGTVKDISDGGFFFVPGIWITRCNNCLPAERFLEIARKNMKGTLQFIGKDNETSCITDVNMRWKGYSNFNDANGIGLQDLDMV